MRDPIDRPSWLNIVRTRAIALAVAGVVAIIAIGSLLTLPAWSVIGAAVVTVAALVNQVTARFNEHACRHCSADLSAEPRGAHGVICPRCGAIADWPLLTRDPPRDTRPALPATLADGSAAPSPAAPTDAPTDAGRFSVDDVLAGGDPGAGDASTTRTA